MSTGTPEIVYLICSYAELTSSYLQKGKAELTIEKRVYRNTGKTLVDAPDLNPPDKYGDLTEAPYSLRKILLKDLPKLGGMTGNIVACKDIAAGIEILKSDLMRQKLKLEREINYVNSKLKVIENSKHLYSTDQESGTTKE